MGVTGFRQPSAAFRYAGPQPGRLRGPGRVRCRVIGEARCPLSRNRPCAVGRSPESRQRRSYSGPSLGPACSGLLSRGQDCMTRTCMLAATAYCQVPDGPGRAGQPGILTRSPAGGRRALMRCRRASRPAPRAWRQGFTASGRIGGALRRPGSGRSGAASHVMMAAGQQRFIAE